jgi:hypothetical protein
MACLWQVLESYVQSYCNCERNDWASMHVTAEYAYTNLQYASTKITCFYAKYRFKPRTKWPTEIEFRNPASKLYRHYITSIHEKVKERMSELREAMRKNYNRQRRSIKPIKKGELVMLNGRNICTKHRCKTLEDKMLGPFEVLSVGRNLRYCKLKLPDSRKMHPVFNIELIERFKLHQPEETNNGNRTRLRRLGD